MLSMRTFNKLRLPLLTSLILGLAFLSGNAHGNTIVNFSDLTLPNAGAQTQFNSSGAVTGYYWSGPDPNGTIQPDGYGYTETVGQFTSGGAAFPNTYDNYYGSWSGWAYSNVNDTTTDGYGNQYAAITGGGVKGPGSTYAVAYGASSAWGTPPTITLPTPTEVLSADITNTTWAYLAMLDGNDHPAKQFTSSDWFLLTISGLDASGQPTGTPVEFYLAEDGNIVTDWENVNLTSLGNDVKSLQFDLTSSDTGTYGMNTPAYFALGDLTLSSVPEPSTLVLLGAAGIAGMFWGYRRRPT
jgi:hypothetical protein